MRIGIDIRAITAAGKGRGLGIYAANLVRHLLQVDHQNQYILFLARNQDVPDFLSPLPETATLVRMRRPTRNIFFWDQVLWFPLLKRLRIEVFHSLVYGVPFLCPCPKVLTIHDLTPLVFPQVVTSFRHKAVFRFNFLSGKYADRIITASTHSKHDLMRILGIPEQKLAVVFDGVGPQYRVIHSTQVLDATKARYGIPGKFVLYVGGFDQHKNLGGLVRAFALLYKQYPLREPLYLVFMGGLTAATEVVKTDVQVQHLAELVIFTGYVPEVDAVHLFNAAEVFVLPSLYEGFGLPVLEAMACGTPVICSNAASLPEVAGDAALQFSPDSPDELCAAMWKVLHDQNLREALRRKGVVRSQRFSWQHTARQTLAVYDHVMRRA